MKLFFIGWSGADLGLTEAVRLLKQKHEIAYWTGDRKEFELILQDFPDTIFHDHFDALYGVPAAGVNVGTFPPPSMELLSKLLYTESTVLTMMNKRFESMLVSERKHLYYMHVRYWYGILTSLRPDSIIFPCAPHTVYDYVIYGLAKLLSIRCIMFELSVVGARTLSMQDFVTGSKGLQEAVATTHHRKFAVNDLPQDIREYYERQKDALADHVPMYMAKQFERYAGAKKVLIKLRSVWDTLTVHKDISVLLKPLTYLPRRFMANMRTEYSQLERVPDFTQTFIYVPLSYQPERTSCPQGGVYVDQLLMLETLSQSVPSNCHIYVKEHPAQWLHRGPDFFSYRYRGYYRAIAKLWNVRLVPIKTDTYTLIERSIAVATVTGTAGFEASLRGKPVLVFGYPWYQHAPGMLRVPDTETCRSAVSRIISGFAPSEEEVVAYLWCLGKESFIGYAEPHGKEVHYLSTFENAAVLSQAIETELQK